MSRRFLVITGLLVALLANSHGGVGSEGGNESDGLLLSTFSICALDPKTGETGVAVTTRLPEVGRLCPFVKAGVGAVATQSYVVVRYGPDGLALLEKGLSPEDVLQELLKDDSQRELRQIGIIDAQGRTGTHTGKGCVSYAGHRVGRNYTAQGNMLVGQETIEATADAFEQTEGSGIELADRLIAALEAGQKAGGDKRKGQKQSAAVVVADPRRKHADGSNITVTLQVAEHADPVAELRRQYDTIYNKLGYRTFSLIEGPDIRELKRKLHEVGYYRKEATDEEFAAHIREPAARVYDTTTAESVDAFRKDHGLPVPSDELGFGRGIVDAELIRLLKLAVVKKRQQNHEKAEK
jgi:uncharacterized Ntn-hydrolase superfamily protein